MRLKGIKPLLAAVLLAFPLVSCSGMKENLLIAYGNIFYSRGDYGQAGGIFVRALEAGEANPYALYSLGASYLAQDEGDAALIRFNEAAADGRTIKRRELAYRIHYNSGIALFQNSNYSGAADEFKKALLIDPSRTQAKHNLELSYLSLERQKDAANVQTSRAGGIRENPAEKRSGVILDFMRQRETERWRSFEWGGNEDASTPDY
ncbi:MAG: tetratricopeptide repeat protein [Spirochaetaceae bacterium]|nr:tetratricopeptide repeat protein [Spirochaetaceae bacterium]